MKIWTRMRRRDFVFTLGIVPVAAVAPRAGVAEQIQHLPLIAMLISTNPEISAARFFLGGLKELGYEEGKNYHLVARYAEVNAERLPGLAEELVRLKPSVLFANDIGAALPASRATSAIPIVCPMLADPVQVGLVASLSRPARNVTGLSSDAPGLLGKQIETASQAITGATKLGLLLDTSDFRSAERRQEAEAAARQLNVAVVIGEASSLAGLEAAVEQIRRAGAPVMVVPPSPLTVGERKRIIALAASARLPAVYSLRFFATDGGLISYGVNAADNFRRAATYVDKILKGAAPGELPVEFPNKLELVINLKTANALGLNIPPALLARADEVIE